LKASEYLNNVTKRKSDNLKQQQGIKPIHLSHLIVCISFSIWSDAN